MNGWVALHIQVGRARRVLRPGHARVSVCTRPSGIEMQAFLYQPLPHVVFPTVRGPDLSGAVLLPSPRQTNTVPFGHASICIAGTQHPCKHKRVPRAHHCTRQKKGQRNMGSNHHHPKTAVIVDVVVRVIPVASGTARVVYCVSPRAATHHLSRPPDQVLPLGGCIIVGIFSSVFPPFPQF